jgi:hypothetical protein
MAGVDLPRTSIRDSWTIQPATGIRLHASRGRGIALIAKARVMLGARQRTCDMFMACDVFSPFVRKASRRQVRRQVGARAADVPARA